jgi:4-amino-4-deoxy-L-arabinose transferase-like glycosyltransferase
VLAGVMLATVYMLSAEARTAKTDATLLLTIILAMGAMARAWLGRARGMGRAGGVLDGDRRGHPREGPADPVCRS